jgi:hypothetical protein
MVDDTSLPIAAGCRDLYNSHSLVAEMVGVMYPITFSITRAPMGDAMAARSGTAMAKNMFIYNSRSRRNPRSA